MNRIRIGSILAFGIFVSLLLFPVEIFAQEGIVPSGRDGDFSPDGFGSCELVATINNTIRFLVGITGILAVIAFMYAGFVMVVSAGDTAMIEQAKRVFANVLIGFAILLSAFLVINTIMNMLIGNEEGLVNWNQVECSYSKQAGDLNTDPIIATEEEFVTPEIFNKQGWTVINRYTQIRTVTSGAASGFDSSGFISAGGGYSSGGAAAGSCAVIRDSNNFCSVSKLRGFGSQAEAASRICNLESGGGQSAIISGTDLCKTGHSFSGGLFQINILANHRYVPGCSANFFVKNGPSAQGSCLRTVTNSSGISYCAVRDCAITNETMYSRCMAATTDPKTNLDIALQLYQAAGGFRPWLTSAQACNVM